MPLSVFFGVTNIYIEKKNAQQTKTEMAGRNWKCGGEAFAQQCDIDNGL